MQQVFNAQSGFSRAMKQRIISAVCMGLFAFIAIEYVSGLFFLMLAVVLILAQYEWGKINGLQSWYLICYVVIGVVLSLSYLDWVAITEGKIAIVRTFGWLILITVVLQTAMMVILIAGRFLNYEPVAKVGVKVEYLFLGVLFIPCAIVCALMLQVDHSVQFWYILLLVIGSDIGGYFAGKLLGKHKLMPLISPGKTIEGAAGGLLISIASALIFVNWSGYSIFQLLLLALTAWFYALMGDLWESLMKRQGDVKDSGTILPGHGGVLDRIDGFLFAIPAYALLSSWMM